MSTAPSAFDCENVKISAAQAWEKEVCRVAQALFKPKSCAFARFFPTDACNEPIAASVSEYLKSDNKMDLGKVPAKC
ncbi:uncharacterized protein N7518_010304 [Penicillium psychrosexuale]|uniref:uncharacterized protein n=1 Tax=Penicillium psychrosexuale TaxID=1002107 RepID=UPI002545902A|nr:uncharacterized protein N7518_010304 [Penicillium psychrosexuale]KAJ5781821.1 hypothetical protein N7518_010304 [Penicillium psychrosexuale]